MTNNGILRRLRYLFNLSDSEMIRLFNLVEHKVEESELSGWAKKEEDPLMVEISDRELALFLNALIIEKRGRQEGPLPEAEDPLSNNMILRKLRVALELKSDDILALFNSVNIKISKHELSAFFRNPEHRSYRPFLDQYLRNFLNALQLKE